MKHSLLATCLVVHLGACGVGSLQSQKIISINPVQNHIQSPVPAITNFNLALSNPIDSATLNDLRVEFETVYQQPFQVRKASDIIVPHVIQSQLYLDASGSTLIIDPKTPLKYGREYRISVWQLGINNSRLLHEFTVSTYQNPEKQYIRYGEGSQVMNYSRWEYYENHQLNKKYQYNKAGNDNQWFTADDEYSSLVEYDRQLNNINALEISYANFGNNMRALSYVTPLYDDMLEYVGIAKVSDPGSNNELLDYDDLPSEVQTGFYDPDAHRIVWRRYNGPGFDDNWRTLSNNSIVQEFHYILNSEQRFEQVYSYIQNYNDKSFAIDPQHLSHVIEYRYDENGYNHQSIWRSPGFDQLWHTNDDSESFCYRYDRNDQGQLVRHILYNPNHDGLCFPLDQYPGDDAIANYEIHQYDERGNRVSKRKYNSPGADLIWFSNDDELQYEYSYYTDF